MKGSKLRDHCSSASSKSWARSSASGLSYAAWLARRKIKTASESETSGTIFRRCGYANRSPRLKFVPLIVFRLSSFGFSFCLRANENDPLKSDQPHEHNQFRFGYF